MEENTLKILDCTIRDGGYYTDWDFDLGLVQRYLLALDAANIDMVEMGFRFLSDNGFKGPFAFTTDRFLETLEIPKSLEVAVMVNVSDLGDVSDVERVVEYLFPLPKRDSKVDMVRLACHYSDLPSAYKAVKLLADKGYRIGLNLMQITERSASEMKTFAKKASTLPVEVLYFADSLGALSPQDISKITEAIRSAWTGPMGIHAHDNLGLALQNSLVACDHGVTWIDATVTGMGRGPGNVLTEELLVDLLTKGKKTADIAPLLTLIQDHFSELKIKSGWGKNPFYAMAARAGIHPTYIQEMLQDGRFDCEDILSVIEHLSFVGGSKLMGLNLTEDSFDRLLSLKVVSHPTRLLSYLNRDLELNHPIVAPLSDLPKEVAQRLNPEGFLDFGLSISDGGFDFHETHCHIPSPLVLAYALSAPWDPHNFPCHKKAYME